MGLEVNGLQNSQKAGGNGIDFPTTGGWFKNDWKERFATVTLVPGANIITLSTTGYEDCSISVVV
jgi:hypothetical protein